MHNLTRRICLAILPALSPFAALADDVSFRNDVMPAISKAGCNAGVCHGNLHGKGGFKLSLRGQDPAHDLIALKREQGGRRTNALSPDESLILAKATMRIPHEGGKRFSKDSPEYEIFRRWIAAGLPDDPDTLPRLTELDVSVESVVIADPQDQLPLTVTARFSDGSTRDVTHLAVYEPAEESIATVTHDGLIRRRGMGETTIVVRFLEKQVPVRVAFIPAREDFVWSGPEPAGAIDEAVFSKLRTLRMNPSPVASDRVFLRRATLDVIGRIPTAAESRRFLNDPREDKRARLVDRLLEHPDYASFWAQKWADLLRVEEKTLDRKGVQNFYAWIRRSIARDKPLNRFAAELVSARGSTYEQPASNYYRAMRDPLMRAETTAQVFLGIRLQCAKCHNHPFDRWTQDDYYGWANLFARVDYKILENRRRDRNDKHEFDGEQVVYFKTSGDVEHPQTGGPAPLRFLGDGSAASNTELSRLDRLADWLADEENGRFAAMQANRIWYHVMGRGVVDPIDDFRATNPPANPELMDALVMIFRESNYSQRELLRTILNSRVYQLSPQANDSNHNDTLNFARVIPRRLTAEQLADSISAFLDADIEYVGYPQGIRAVEIPGIRARRRRDARPTEGDRFLKLFGKPSRLQSCECERSDEPTLDQTFQLISGELVNNVLRRPENRIGKLLDAKAPDAAIVEELFQAALSRPPSKEERQASLELLSRSADRRRTIEDVAWGLINSNEFLFRQ